MYRHWSNFKKKKNSYIYRLFCLLNVNLIGWSFNSFVNVHVDRVDINQCFQNRECFAFDHRVDRIVDFMYSFYFRDFSSLVWLSKTHDVYHDTLFLRRVEFYKTVVQRFWINTKYQRYETIENRRQRVKALIQHHVIDEYGPSCPFRNEVTHCILSLDYLIDVCYTR
jgi:hypothetical protein